MSEIKKLTADIDVGEYYEKYVELYNEQGIA